MAQNGKANALLLAAAVAFAAAICLILLEPAGHKARNPYVADTRSDRQLVRDGNEIKEHTEFVEMVKRDLGIDRPIKILKGPYMFAGTGRWVESPLCYYILVDDGFWEEASDIEQKALLAHEMGHFIYSSPSQQVGADEIAARYTSPEAVISVINKIRYRLIPMSEYSEMMYDKRIESLEKFKQGR